MLSKTVIEFKSESLLSDFLKVFMKSENAKELFHCIGNDGNNYFIELNTRWVEHHSC